MYAITGRGARPIAASSTLNEIQDSVHDSEQNACVKTDVCRIVCAHPSPGVKEIAVLMLKSQVICHEQTSHPGRQRALCLDLCTDLCI